MIKKFHIIWQIILILMLFSCEKEQELKDNDLKYSNFSKIYTYNLAKRTILDWDKGIVLAGNTNVFNSSQSQIYKVDSLGNYMWRSTFGGNGYDIINDIIKISSGYISVGCSQTEKDYIQKLVIACIDIRGVVFWQRDYGRGIANCIIDAYDDNYNGDYVIGGKIIEYDSIEKLDVEKLSLIKINNQGSTIWTFKNLTPAYCGSEGFSVIRDGQSFIIAGYLNDYSGENFYVLVDKIDSNGKLIWEKRFQPKDSSIQTSKFYKGVKIIKNVDGYLVGSNLQQFPVDLNESFLTKLSTNGDIIWRKSITSNFELLDMDVYNNQIYIIGKKILYNSRVYKDKLILLDNSGDILKQYSFAYLNDNRNETPNSLIISRGSIIIGGTVLNDSTLQTDMYVIKKKLSDLNSMETK